MTVDVNLQEYAPTQNSCCDCRCAMVAFARLCHNSKLTLTSPPLLGAWTFGRRRPLQTGSPASCSRAHAARRSPLRNRSRSSSSGRSCATRLNMSPLKSSLEFGIDKQCNLGQQQCVAHAATSTNQSENKPRSRSSACRTRPS